ncbi:MAG: hypothetical protein U0Q16_09830 [Bryobacteraceae bacterium]
MFRIVTSLVIFVFAAAFTSVFFINFCATVYQCGCQSLWTVADRYCNIHAQHGRHCPWCSFGYAGYVMVYGTMLAAQGLAVIVTAGRAMWMRVAVALAAFPVTGLVLALALGLYTGYWH